MTIAIGPASTNQDWQQAVALLKHVYVSDGYTSLDRADAFMRRETLELGGTLLLARNAPGAVLGAVLLLHSDGPLGQVADPGEAEFRVLAVAPEARGTGVGETLVRACIVKAKERGARALVLWSQPTMHSAHRLYERLSFVRAHERDEADPRGFARQVFRLSW